MELRCEIVRLQEVGVKRGGMEERWYVRGMLRLRDGQNRVEEEGTRREV